MRTLMAMAVGGMVAGAAGALELHVSPEGNDAWSGTLAVRNAEGTDGPVATLAGAREALRRQRRAGRGIREDVSIWIAAGDYAIAEPFELAEEDGGRDGHRVTYRARQDRTVRLYGGRRIPASAFGPVTGAAANRLAAEARPHVVGARLPALGITAYGEVPVRYRGAAGLPELFFNDRRLRLARWPNDGWAEIREIVERGSVPRQGDRSNTPGAFRYAGERPSRWSVEDGVWLHGYWCFDWYDEVIKVASIDPAEQLIRFAAPHFYGVRQGNPPPRRWRAVNVLAELDQAGEYYLDRHSGVLYLWPPAPLDDARVVVSTLAAPLVKAAGVGALTVRGLIVENGRGDGLVVEDCEDVEVLACTVRNVGGTGVIVNGGRACVVRACDIHDTGTLGLNLHGGDRRQLISASHEAVNNHIHHFSRLQRTYASGIHVTGVGNRVAHNLLHDAPHQAIGLGGNDHVIELNVIHHVCMETDDCGAFYKGRNPSNRGNVVRHNFWHHIGSPRGHGNNAVYFDDGDGGDRVVGNVFFRCGEPAKGNMGAVFSHGGHDLLIENNVFVECKRAVGASPWNDKRWRDMLDGELWQQRLLEEVDITSPVYQERYPELRGFMTPDGSARMSTLRRNVAVMCGSFVYGNFETENNWVTDEDPGFVDPARGNFAFRDLEAVRRQVPGFEPIPLERMGLVKSHLRPDLPDAPWTYPPPAPLEPPRPPRTWTPPVVREPRERTHTPRFAVPDSESTVTVDGRLTEAEWGEPDKRRTMLLAEDYQRHPAEPVSRAWLTVAGDRLLLAVDSAIAPRTPTEGHQWGVNDAVEVAFRTPMDADAPIWVLRGYLDGHLFVGRARDAADDPVAVPGKEVLFAAARVEPGRWTAEWSIPLSQFGLSATTKVAVPFSLTVRKSAANLWLMWAGTGGHSYNVAEAGELVLSP